MAVLTTLVRRHSESFLIHTILIAGSLVMAYPFAYGVLAGMSSLVEFSRAVFLPVPGRLSLDNLNAVFAGADFGTMFRNSTIISLWYAFFPALMALISGYAFARLRFPGKNVAFLLLLASLMVPGQVSIVPIYIMAARWPFLGGNNILGQGGSGMIDTWWSLLSLGLVNAYAIFFLRQSIQTVPYEYDEAARMDGAGVMRIIFQIYLPMLKPVMATVAVLSTIIGTSAINKWNDYFTPLIFTNGGELNTVALGATNFAGAVMANGQPNYPLLFMGASISMMPTILVFLIFQRYLVQGFAMTGIKG